MVLKDVARQAGSSLLEPIDNRPLPPCLGRDFLGLL